MLKLRTQKTNIQSDWAFPPRCIWSRFVGTAIWETDQSRGFTTTSHLTPILFQVQGTLHQAAFFLVLTVKRLLTIVHSHHAPASSPPGPSSSPILRSNTQSLLKLLNSGLRPGFNNSWTVLEYVYRSWGLKISVTVANFEQTGSADLNFSYYEQHFRGGSKSEQHRLPFPNRSSRPLAWPKLKQHHQVTIESK